MKASIIFIILSLCATVIIYSQEDGGVVSFNLPVRNSLTFNRYAINPTFSFVREQNKYISLYNKRQWVQFDNAPLTYLLSYSGRFAENIGAGIGLFQQDYGVLSTFGGVLNFAYNVRLVRESNLTFGLNVGTYKSGINTGNVVTNYDDPSINNVPNNTIVTINPGINIGFEFIDIGISAKNLVAYNFKSSEILKDDPESSIQAHIMYTGYMDSRGFFDESKFTTLVRSEFKKDKTIVSGLAMLSFPLGFWGQLGYNSVYGVSGGLGINITSQIALEYNYEKSLGDLIDFGSSHNLTLAYRFKNNKNYYYGGNEEISGIISTNLSRKPSKSKISKELAEANRKKAEERKAQAKLLAEQKAKEEAEAQAKLLAEQKAKEEAEAQAKLLAEQKAKEEAEAQAKLLAEQKAKEKAEAQAKILAEQKAKEKAEAQAKILAEQKAKEKAEAQAKLLAEQKAKEEAEAQAKLLAEQRAKEEAEAQAKLLAEQKANEELIDNPSDDLGKAMNALIQQAEDSKNQQKELFENIDEIVKIKSQDLKDLKEENDLSEQGIAVEPKPFKSVTEENKRLQSMIAKLDEVIESRNQEIEELKQIYNDKYENTVESDTIYLDEVYMYYKNTLKRLTAEQIKATQDKIKLQVELKNIQVATEYERNRRIKRALYNNEDQRHAIDRAALKNIKETTQTNKEFKAEDFDFGEEQSSNIQILKNIKHVESGYYLILAVHNDIQKRNDFVKKVYASGRTDVDFFYDVTSSKYFIYCDKFDDINQANEALKSKGNKPYNKKMSLVKIEN